jgi:hypothetical protein
MAPLSSTVRQPAPDPEELPEGVDVHLDAKPAEKKSVVIKLPDGSVNVSVGGGAEPAKPMIDAKFDANLALHVAEDDLGTLCNELLQGIAEDDRSRADWLQERADGIKLLALKVEKPATSTAGSGADNTSRTRHSLLLEAVLRFQANARGELLPADGPVKVEGKMGRDTKRDDELAQRLEDDLNYYLTTTATEFYPDTDRMLFWTGFGGIGIKKVYRCPLRRRPVSESVDAEDLIVSNGATDLMNADRVTQVVKMSQRDMKRMKKLKVYRDVDLSAPSHPMPTAVDVEKMSITGVTLSMRPEDAPHTLYECYCMIDVPGDEQKENGEETGIPRPYKVTIDKNSQQILEIRRNWKHDDKIERRRRVFVEFPYVPGFGFYALGLVHIAGNMTAAATALQRLMIDNGIFGNFPGGVMAKNATSQNSMDLNVPPGTFAPIDVSMIPDGDVRKALMPMPYKGIDGALMTLFEKIVETGSRVAGAAEIAVGEGRQDAPVGTTIALIEQATKVVDAVHKRLHGAQSTEFQMIRDLFREYPEDFWRFNTERDTNWDSATLLAALNDNNLVPRADPNTSSSTQRILRAQALYMMVKANPEIFNVKACFDYIMRSLGIRNPDSFANQQPPGQQPNPEAQAKLLDSQSDMLDAQTKAKDAQFKIANAAQQSQQAQQADQTKVKIAQMELQREGMIEQAHMNHETVIERAKMLHETQLQREQQQHEKGMGVLDAMKSAQPPEQQGVAP